MTLPIGLNSSPHQARPRARLWYLIGCSFLMCFACENAHLVSPVLRVVRLHSPLSYSSPTCPVDELGVRARIFREAHQASKALGRTYTSKIPGTVRNGGP
jgi:hypothetical protein